MKIIYGITKSNFGGAQRYVFDLARASKKAGHEVAVLCGEGGVLVEKLKQEGIRVIEIKGLKRNISLVHEFTSFKILLTILRSEKPDVFHTNSSKMGGLGNLAGRLVGVKKIIFTSHGWAFDEAWRPVWQKQIIKLLSWIIIFLSHTTIAVSEKTKSKFSSWPLTSRKIKVVRNGIEAFPLLSHTEAREKLKIEEGKLAVVTLAELHKVKGLDLILRAWQKFDQRFKAKLYILGTGEEKSSLEKIVSELGISDSVEFRGYVENAREYLPGFDIFVFPSRSENMPYAILEAGFAGLPVLSTKVGGIPEIIETGVNGVLVERERSDLLYSSLILLAESHEVRKRLGDNLHTTVLENFNLEKMTRDTLKVYE